MIKITPKEIKIITKYIYDVSGIYLDQNKSYLLETRLGSVAQGLSCKSYQELCDKAKADTSQSIQRKIINAISTNETLFFRDQAPFELLKHKLLPEIIDAKKSKFPGQKTKFSIWSAASSTGQELYSISMIIKELIPDLSQYTIKLLGTDISDTVITQAISGKYNKFEIERGLPHSQIEKYFIRDGDFWKIKDDLRAMVNFRKFNLMQPFSALGKFDIILCRNVAIYFTQEDRKKLFDKIADSLADDGVLIIGSTESLTGVCPRFVPQRHLRSIFYQKKKS